MEVHGIGPRNASHLAADGINNTFQLIGKFLSLKGSDAAGKTVGSVEHMNKFWFYLQEKKVSSHRSGIVKAIAEKLATMMPGLLDEGAYDEGNTLLAAPTIPGRGERGVFCSG